MKLFEIKRLLEGFRITRAERMGNAECAEWGFTHLPLCLQINEAFWLIPAAGHELQDACSFLDIKMPDAQFVALVTGQKIVCADYLQNEKASERGMLYRPLCLTLEKGTRLIPFVNNVTKSGWITTAGSEKLLPNYTEIV